MDNNKKKGLLALLGFGTLAYIIWKKPAVTIQQSFTEGGGSGGGGIFMMPSAPAPAASTTTTTTGGGGTTSGGGTGSGTTTQTTDPCGGMGKYNTTTKMCDNDTRCGGAAYDPVAKKCLVGGAGTGGSGVGGGGSQFEIYDPCKKNGYGGTYDAASNRCLKSTYCGGTDAILDKNGIATGCATGGPTGGGGMVVVGFSGQVPLTLDNLLH